MSLSVSSSMRDTTYMVCVSGEVDVSNAADLRSVIDEALEQGNATIKVDLEQVSYIDSTGIGVLVGAAHRAEEAGGRLTVTNPQRNGARVLSLLGVDEQLGVEL